MMDVPKASKREHSLLIEESRERVNAKEKEKASNKVTNNKKKEENIEDKNKKFKGDARQMRCAAGHDKTLLNSAGPGRIASDKQVVQKQSTMERIMPWKQVVAQRPRDHTIRAVIPTHKLGKNDTHKRAHIDTAKRNEDM